MRILIATSHRNLVGGVEKYLQAVIPGLLNQGHEIALLHENRFDAKHESIDDSTSPAWCAAELGMESALHSVAKWKPCVVYCHGLELSGLEDALLNAYPTVLYAHNYYGTCISGTKCHSSPHASPCARRFGPSCLLLYYPRRCGGLHPGTMWGMFRRQSRLNSGLPRFRSVLVASRHMLHEFQQNGVSRDKLYLVPLPATDMIPQPVAPTRGRPQGRILFVGRLTGLKGVDYLIKALSKVAEKIGRVTLTIAGEGPERQRLADLANRLGIEAEFTGWLQTQRKLDLIRQADLLAVPSLWPEPFGLVGLEAGSLGLPAVGYAVGGIPDWLIPGRSGELAPGDPPTVDGLTQAIIRALADPDHYATLCRGAWETAAQFTMEAHLAKLEPILRAAGQLNSSRDLNVEGEHVHA